MDDQNFSKKTAQEWIELIESDRAKVRDEDILPRLTRWLNAHKIQQVLDLGCGQGACSEWVHDSKFPKRNYVGIDPSPFLIERAKERYSAPHRSFEVGNAYSIPSVDASFDGVFSIAVLHLLEDIHQFVREVARVLQPGGGFFIVTANPARYELWTAAYSQSQQEQYRFEGWNEEGGERLMHDVLFLYPLEQILHAFTQNGLTVKTQETFRGDKFLVMTGVKI